MRFFDAHFHVIDPRFSLVPNQGYLPPAFTSADYLERVGDYDLMGGAIVSGSFQAFDQEYLIDALARLGDQFCAVANIPETMTDVELERLNRAGVVAVRFNLKRGGGAGLEHLEYLSDQLFDLYGWHTELYVDSRELPALRSRLSGLKRFSIDHLGLSKSGLKELYYWVEKGVRVKATGFGRIDFEPIPVLRKIYELNPKALLFGTDLPSTRARVPFSNLDIQILKDNFSEQEQARIFYKNALEWYRRH